MSLREVPPPDDAIIQIERALVGGLILEPAQVESVHALVTVDDFFDPAACEIAKVLFEAPTPLADVPAIRDALDARDKLAVIGGITTLVDISLHTTPAGLLPGMAEDVSLASLARRIRSAASRLAADPTNHDSLDELSLLKEQAEGLRARRAVDGLRLEDIAFAGRSFMDLLDEPQPEAVYPGIPPDGHFSLVVAPSFSGKTSLVLWIAMARIKGQAPWIGAPAREPGRVLFYSIDEPPAQVAHRIQALSAKHPAGRFMTEYAHGFTIVGPHKQIDPEKLNALRFTEAGIQILASFLRDAEKAGEPFTDVIVDAYSDLLPEGEEDTSNREATRIGGHLERLAVTHGCAIQVIHHAGKPKQNGEVPDPRDLGRGASALAAKARAIFTLEEEVGMPNVRKIRTRTNLTASPGPLLVEVSDDRSAGTNRLDFFRPHDTAKSYPINEYLTPEDDWISVTQLARRIAGETLDPEKRPSGNLIRKAKELRGIWENAGLAETRTGARSALEMRRA